MIASSGRGLVHTAASGNGNAGDDLAGGCGCCKAVGVEEREALVEGERAGSGDVLEEERVGVVVFVPGVDAGVGTVGHLGELLGHARLFKGRADEIGGSGGGEDPGEHALGDAGNGCR